MTFGEAYRKMREGDLITHEDFNGGYWVWENDTIMIHCHDGTVLDIRETDDVGYTFGFIAEDKWHIINKVYLCVKDFELPFAAKDETISAGTEWEEHVFPYHMGRRLVNDNGDMLCVDKQIKDECFKEIALIWKSGAGESQKHRIDL